RAEAAGNLPLRYLPIANLTQDGQGIYHFDRVELRADFPLRMFEDARLAMPDDNEKAAWLNEWHTDVEWLHALHKTQYSNGLIGLHEQFTQFTAPATDVN